MKRRWTKRDEEGGEDGRCISILLLLMLLFVLRALGGKGCEKWGWMWKMWSVIIIHVLLLMWWRDGQGQEADEGEASRSWRPM